MAHFTAQLARLEIGHDDDLLANERRRVVPGTNARTDLAAFGCAIVEADLQEFVGVGMRLGAEHRGDAKIKLREVLELNRGERFVAHDVLRT